MIVLTGGVSTTTSSFSTVGCCDVLGAGVWGEGGAAVAGVGGVAGVAGLVWAVALEVL